MRIPPNKETQKMTCSGCGHVVSKHDLTTMYGSQKINAKCKLCECDKTLTVT